MDKGLDNVLVVGALGIGLWVAEARGIPAGSSALAGQIVAGLLGYLAKAGVVAGATFLAHRGDGQ